MSRIWDRPGDRAASRGGECAVVVADLEADPSLNTVRLIEKAGGRAVWVRTDVRIDSDCEGLVAMAERTYGGLDILVNCAGGTPSPHFPDADVTHWSATLELNLRGPMVATQTALEALKRRSGGAIVNIASTAAWAICRTSHPNTVRLKQA